MVSFGSIFLCNQVMAEKANCKGLVKEREVFKKSYSKARYLEAYQRLDKFLQTYSKNESCKNQNLDQQLWAYSDLALTAYKLKDPEKCFQQFPKINQLQSYGIEGEEKAKSAILHNYKMCLGLKDGLKTALKYDCDTYGNDFCRSFKDEWIEKLESKKAFKRDNCKSSEFEEAISLKTVGQKGCLVLKPFSKDGDEHMCPKIYWQKGNQKNELKIIAKLNKLRTTQAEILDESNCCNIGKGSLSLAKEKSKILLRITSAGRDCYGGTAAWYSYEVYEVLLKEKKLELKEDISIYYR